MEEFIFVAPDGDVYRKQLIGFIDGKKIRHGHIARDYVHIRQLSIIDVDPETENGFYWGKELAKNHSTLTIQNCGDSGSVFIPVELNENQKMWIKNNLMNEIAIFNGLLIVCDFVNGGMNAYVSNKCNVIEELEKCLKEKGVDIKKEVSTDDIGNKRRYN